MYLNCLTVRFHVSFPPMLLILLNFFDLAPAQFPPNAYHIMLRFCSLCTANHIIVDPDVFCNFVIWNLLVIQRFLTLSCDLDMCLWSICRILIKKIIITISALIVLRVYLICIRVYLICMVLVGPILSVGNLWGQG